MRKPRKSKIVFENAVEVLVWVKSPDTGKLEPMIINKRTPSLTKYITKDEAEGITEIVEDIKAVM